MLHKLKHLSKYPRNNIWRLLYGSKWVASGAIIFNDDDKLLLIRHRWRAAWEYPVGVTDGTESPLDAARRETKEEVGLSPDEFHLLGIDFFERNTPNGNLIFTYSAHVNAAQLAELKIDAFEATGYRWVTREEAQELISGRLKNRFSELLKAHAAGTTVYLQSGKIATK
jgi:8-oxo-dGTP diphosphatase